MTPVPDEPVWSTPEVESLAAWEGSFRESMNRPWMGEWFSQMMPLVESGSREFYSIVE